MALAAYRNVLRATHIAFKGDTRMILAARDKIRENFRQRTSITEPQIPFAIQRADEVAQMLRENIVQGKRHKGSHLYKLRIHDETEQGDNDSISKANEQGEQGEQGENGNIGKAGEQGDGDSISEAGKQEDGDSISEASEQTVDPRDKHCSDP